MSRKPVRKIIVDGIEFRWVLPGNSAWNGDCIRLTAVEDPRSTLRIETTPHDLEIRPKSIAAAISFALRSGWDPHVSGDYGATLEDGRFRRKR